MSTPFVCIFIAFLLCYAPKLPLSLAMARQKGGYDNKHPRLQQARLRGFGARALAAQHNAFEAFGPFAAGVLIAHLAGLDERRATLLAITFVVARTLYIGAYLANLDYLRSAIWGVGFLSTAALYVLSWVQ